MIEPGTQCQEPRAKSREPRVQSATLYALSTTQKVKGREKIEYKAQSWIWDGFISEIIEYRNQSQKGR